MRSATAVLASDLSQKDKMIQVSARETKRAHVPDERNPGFAAEIFTTLIAS